MTFAVAKNCKMTKKSDIDDVINTSKMSDMPQNIFFLIRMCLDNCPYQVSNPYKVFNLVAVANMCVKNTSRFMGGGCTPPLWGATETTFHSSEK